MFYGFEFWSPLQDFQVFRKDLFSIKMMRPPTMKRTSSRERAEKAKPIFGADDDAESTKVEILFSMWKE